VAPDEVLLYQAPSGQTYSIPANVSAYSMIGMLLVD
jgi:hypothetical protein